VRKLFCLALVAAGFAAFVGFDVVGAAVRRARESVRASLTSDVPLKTQLAEARRTVDAYAENVIRGEVAADALKEMIDETEKEVRARERTIERNRQALVVLKGSLEANANPAVHLASDGPKPVSDLERDAVRAAADFEASSSLLERRQKDLAAMRREHEATLREVASAKAEQARLSQEVRVLEAEIESLEARTNVARTREACRDATVDRSGYGAASERIQAIRREVRERNKKLEYYAMRRDDVLGRDADPTPSSAMEAVTSALERGVVPAPVVVPTASSN
jgi:chromosome segregation ATPase